MANREPEVHVARQLHAQLVQIAAELRDLAGSGEVLAGKGGPMTPTAMIDLMRQEPVEAEHIDEADQAAPDVVDLEAGRTRLLSERCASCILRPGGLALRPGRLKEFLGEAVESGGFVVCHETLPELAPDGVEPAVCRGFADRYDTPRLRMIRALWGFVEVPPPDLVHEAKGN